MKSNIYECGPTQLNFVATYRDFTRGLRFEEGRVQYFR